MDTSQDPAPQGAVLQARGLRKRYGAHEVVQGIDLTLPAGQIRGLLGPNGAGKSTTVAMLAGLLPPDAGEVRVLGERLAGDAQAVKARIGLVPQELALHETLTAAQNLRSFGALYGLHGRALDHAVASALDLAGLQPQAGSRVDTFSGGMKRRLHIAVALLHDPAVVFLDEPTAGVDPQSRNAIFEALEQLRDAGKALLYTTHYMEEAERLCDHLTILDQGRVMAEGSLAALHEQLPLKAELSVQLNRPLAPQDLLDLGGRPGVLQFEATDERRCAWRVGLEQMSVAPALVIALHERGYGLELLATRRPSLEQLFLHLTGRRLRD